MTRQTTIQVACPACGTHLPCPKTSAAGLHLRCPACRTNLVLEFKYMWVYSLICLVGAATISHVQGLDGPLFVMLALVYAGVLVIIGTQVLLPFFPIQVRLDRSYLQTLLK
jgi:hypothetical protein